MFYRVFRQIRCVGPGTRPGYRHARPGRPPIGRRRESGRWPPGSCAGHPPGVFVVDRREMTTASPAADSSGDTAGRPPRTSPPTSCHRSRPTRRPGERTNGSPPWGVGDDLGRVHGDGVRGLDEQPVAVLGLGARRRRQRPGRGGATPSSRRGGRGAAKRSSSVARSRSWAERAGEGEERRGESRPPGRAGDRHGVTDHPSGGLGSRRAWPSSDPRQSPVSGVRPAVDVQGLAGYEPGRLQV